MDELRGLCLLAAHRNVTTPSAGARGTGLLSSSWRLAAYKKSRSGGAEPLARADGFLAPEPGDPRCPRHRNGSPHHSWESPCPRVQVLLGQGSRIGTEDFSLGH